MGIYSMGNGHSEEPNTYGVVPGGYFFPRIDGVGTNPLISEIDAVNVRNLNTREEGITVYVWEESANSQYFRGDVFVSPTETNAMHETIKADVGDVIRVSSLMDPEVYVDINVIEGGLFLQDEYVLQEDEIKNVNLWSSMYLPVNGIYELEIIGGKHIIGSIDGYEVTFTPEENWFGSEDFIIRVKDSNGELLYTDNTRVRVTEVNDLPLLVGDLSDNHLKEDFESFEMDLAEYYFDVEGDEIAYSVDFNQANIDCKLEGTVLTISSIENWNGTAVISITADDQISRKDRDITPDLYALVIESVNDLPEIISSSPEEEIVYLDILNEEVFTVEAIDVDDENIDYLWKLDNEYIERDSVYVGVSFHEYGIHSLEIIVSDGKGQISKSVGQLVKKIVDEKMLPGNHKVIWNGRNDENRRCSSGVYFYNMKTKGYQSTKKMLLLK